MFHAETRRRLVRRIPAEGLDPCGYGVDVFLFANRHLIVVCTQTGIFRCFILFEAVVCRLYEMLYPCICNVVISCWKSGAYGYVICRGGTDMCFVPGSGWKHLDLEQYRISGLTTWYQSLTDCRIPLLVEVESRQKLFCSYYVSYRRVGIFLLLTSTLVRTSAVSVLISPYPLSNFRISSVWRSKSLQCFAWE